MRDFIMPAADWDENNPDKKAIRVLINKHAAERARMEKLLRYYKGEHDILHDEGRENKLVCNHAKDISDTASSYFIGEPISYSSDEDLTDLTDVLDDAEADEADGDNGLDLSICGTAYEYVYTKKDETSLMCKNLDADNTFMVYDDTIEKNELFAVYYFAKVDDTGRRPVEYRATILTQNLKWELDIVDDNREQMLTEQPEPHFKGEVPVIKYMNNKLGLGDFELQIPLIDAYNALMSDRITDKEQFIDSILAIYGTLLSDEDYDDDEDENGSDDAMKRLKRRKLLELPDSTRAEYLTRTFDESGVEILKKAIEQDIHKFSHIPCMTDEAFGGNVSGVAMEFKLLGLENITKIKTRYYKKGLRKRMRLFKNFYSIKGINLNVDNVKMSFTRALPKNLLEISQIVANLWGKVSKKTLLAQVPFVTDVDAELEAVQAEAEEAAKQQQEIFGGFQNTPPQDPEKEEPEEQEE